MVCGRRSRSKELLLQPERIIRTRRVSGTDSLSSQEGMLGQHLLLILKSIFLIQVKHLENLSERDTHHCTKLTNTLEMLLCLQSVPPGRSQRPEGHLPLHVTDMWSQRWERFCTSTVEWQEISFTVTCSRSTPVSLYLSVKTNTRDIIGVSFCVSLFLSLTFIRNYEMGEGES